MFKIPKSKIKTGLYTSTDEYVYKASPKNVYKGDYYKYNGKFYAGKTFNSEEKPKEIELAKKTTYNKNNFLYDVLAGIQQGAGSISNTPVKKTAVLLPWQLAETQNVTREVGINNDADIDALNAFQEDQVSSSTTSTRKRYFYRQTISAGKTASYKFGEVTEDDFDLLTQRPNYITATITETRIPGQVPFLDEKELNNAEAKMPGLKAFLENGPQTPAETIATPANPNPSPPSPEPVKSPVTPISPDPDIPPSQPEPIKATPFPPNKPDPEPPPSSGNENPPPQNSDPLPPIAPIVAQPSVVAVDPPSTSTGGGGGASPSFSRNAFDSTTESERQFQSQETQNIQFE
jgi:hypothetical protein